MKDYFPDFKPLTRFNRFNTEQFPKILEDAREAARICGGEVIAATPGRKERVIDPFGTEIMVTEPYHLIALGDVFLGASGVVRALDRDRRYPTSAVSMIASWITARNPELDAWLPDAGTILREAYEEHRRILGY